MRARHGRSSAGQRHNLSLICLLCAILAASLAGCSPQHSTSLDAAYRAARLKFQEGDLAGAILASDEASRRYSHTDPEWAWRFRTLQAEALVWRGLSGDALALLDSSLPSSLENSDISVRRDMVRGIAYGFLREFDQAQEHLLAAQKLAKASQPTLLGEVTLDCGTLAVLRNDYPAADEYFRQSLQLARENKESFLEANSLGSLGLVAMRQEHFGESIDWYKQSLELSRSLGARTSTAKTLGNMGWSYYRMGDYDAALSLFTEAEKTSDQLGLVKDRQIWLTNLGAVHHSQGDFSGAEEFYEKALGIARTLENKAAVSESLNDLSFAELEQGQVDLAQQHNQEASEIERSSHDQTGTLYSWVVAGRIQTAKNQFAAAKKYFTQVIRDPAADTSLRWEAQARLAQVYRAEKRPAASERQFQQSIETIEKARASLNREEFRLSFLTSAIEFYDEYIDFLISQGRSSDALKVAELSRARTMAEGLGFRSGALTFPVRNFEPQRIARRLHSVVLSYWLGSHRSYLWVVTPSRVVLFTLPPEQEIDLLVHSYRRAAVGPRDVLETQNAEGKKLFEVLIDPAKDLIPNGSRVTVLPDGSLYGLNFETLLAPFPQLHYWIEDVTITDANSLLLLAASTPEPAMGSRNLLLIGDPMSANKEFPDLPQAPAEMSRIEKYFPQADQTVLSRGRATAAAYFQSNPGKYSFVHFAAHGTASRTSPLDSAVVLTKTGDSYKLYARDIIQRHLRADLVTISACRGAGERTYSGEGLVGLTWAFLRAGAHSVIAALWEVNDNSTPQLMDQLYSEISRGTSPDAALRNAKLSLIRSGTVYRKPFYWAPFQIYRGS
jgi:CHAT domain-containing protein/Tfp pilus assembly protein PilF